MGHPLIDIKDDSKNHVLRKEIIHKLKFLKYLKMFEILHRVYTEKLHVSEGVCATN